MEREIRFRIWDKWNERMLLPTDMNGNKKDLSWLFGQFEELQKGENDPVLMQYTGLKDKDGEEIYEGDICRLTPKPEYEEERSMIGARKVVWSVYYASFYYDQFIPMTWGGFKSVEIIGNIYENPELLERNND